MRLELATGPVSWGVDFAGAPTNPPWRAVLEGIAAAGLERTELGPLGYLPEEAGLVLDRLGVRITGGFVFESLDHPRAIGVARRVCKRVAALGGRFLVLIDAVTPERARTAGDTAAAPRLGAADRAALGAGIDALAEVARAHGLRPVVHPHAGTRIEFADEIAAAAERCELCLDTGHIAYAGLDPVEIYDRYADRVPYLHLKDFDPERCRGEFDAERRRGEFDPERSRGDFWTSVAAGAFRPLGEGCVDLPALFARLEAQGYEGVAVIEQDRAPGGDPVADLRRSRAYVEEALACRA